MRRGWGMACTGSPICQKLTDSPPPAPATPADRRKAVLLMLNDPEWGQWSDHAIAKKCGVTNKTVASYRQSILGNSLDSPPTTRKVERAGKVYEQDTTKIGRQTAPGKAKRASKTGSSRRTGVDQPLTSR